MTNELKPCPLCGPDSFIMTFTRQPLSPDTPFWNAVLKCDYCGISLSGTGVTEKLALESAIEAWNTRAEQTCRIEGVSGGVNRESVSYRLSCGHVVYMSRGVRFKHCYECGAQVVKPTKKMK